LRLAYVGVTNVFALLRLLPMSERDKDVEILALRHQLTVLERQLATEKVRLDASDRALLAARLHRLPRAVVRRVRLLVRVRCHYSAKSVTWAVGCPGNSGHMFSGLNHAARCSFRYSLWTSFGVL
jgi:hypothetical protein